MDTAVSSSTSSHLSGSQPAKIKPCQRNCKGLMMYFPPAPSSDSVDKQPNTSSWRSSEPFCFGFSSVSDGQVFDLRRAHEARSVPAGQKVDFSIVLGHSVYQSNVLTHTPPGCVLGIEVLRFSKTSGGSTISAPASSMQAPSSSMAGSTPSTSNLHADASDTFPSMPSATKGFSAALSSLVNGFRVLSSNADTSARLNKTWESISGFDLTKYSVKFQAQAAKNVDSMSKWLRDLQSAVSKPKA